MADAEGISDPVSEVASPLNGIPHHKLEDVYALCVGSALVVLGLIVLHAAGLTTGGVAGIALLISYLMPVPVGVLLLAINLPFLVIAFRVMGKSFAAKTIAANALITGLSMIASQAVHKLEIAPGFAAFAGGTAIGMGALALARHGAGVGGSGVVTLTLQKTRGWNAGRTQMLIDAAIMGFAAPVIGPWRTFWSGVSAVAMSGILLAWHRPGRYIGY